MNTPKNSAELYMETVRKLHACGNTMLNGATPQSVTMAAELIQLSNELHGAIQRENTETIQREQARDEARKVAQIL